MIEVRPPANSELKGLIEFLDKNLRHEKSWSILNEYPVAFQSKNLKNIRVIFEDGKIVSHAVVKNLLVKTPIAIFKVAAIGSVVTDENHRNKGYGRRVVEECLKFSQEDDCDFAILWTDRYDFYRNLGFELAGSEVALIMHSPIECDSAGLKFLKSNKVDPNAIMKLYSKQSVSSIRSTSDLFNYLQIPNCELYTAWDQHNNLLAYAVEGRGADLSNYIHEWGGGVSKLIPLFNEIRKAKGESITVISPSHSINLIHKMQEKGVFVNNGYLGMIKLLNLKNMFFKIRRFARYLGQDDFILEHNGQDFIVGHSGHIFRTNSEKDIVRLIFGPQKVSELKEFDLETMNILEKIFPLPMWVWGWDSV